MKLVAIFALLAAVALLSSYSVQSFAENQIKRVPLVTSTTDIELYWQLQLGCKQELKTPTVTMPSCEKLCKKNPNDSVCNEYKRYKQDLKNCIWKKGKRICPYEK